MLTDRERTPLLVASTKLEKGLRAMKNIELRLTEHEAGVLMNLLERTIDENYVSVEIEPDKTIRQAIYGENDTLTKIRANLYVSKKKANW